MHDIRSVHVGGSVKAIGSGAFYHCNNIEELRFADGLREICNRAFAMGVYIDSIIIPESVKRIGDYAFWGTKIGKIFIPDTLESVGKYIFQYGNSDMKIMTTERVAEMIMAKHGQCYFKARNFVIIK